MSVRERLVVPVLFLVAFVSYANNLMVAPLMTDMAADYGVEVSRLGLLITVYGLIVGAISLVAGSLSDRYGRRRTIIVCSLLAAVTTVLFTAARDLSELYALRVLNALTTGPLLACAYAAIGDFVAPERRGRATGFVTSALFMSTIVGVPIALLLNQVQGLDWRAAFHGIALLSVLACLGAAVLPRPASAGGGRIDLAALVRGYLAVLSDSRLVGFILVFLLVYVGNGMYITYYPSYLVLERELSTSALAVVYLAGGVCAYAATHWAGRIADRVDRRRMATVASATLAASMIGILYVPTSAATIMWAAIGSAIVYMSSEGFRLTALQTEAIGLAEAERRGTFMGLIASAIAVGTSVGAASGSVLLGRFAPATGAERLIGYDYDTFAAIVFMALSLLLLHVGTRRADAARA